MLTGGQLPPQWDAFHTALSWPGSLWVVIMSNEPGQALGRPQRMGGGWRGSYACPACRSNKGGTRGCPPGSQLNGACLQSIIPSLGTIQGSRRFCQPAGSKIFPVTVSGRTEHRLPLPAFPTIRGAVRLKLISDLLLQPGYWINDCPRPGTRPGRPPRRTHPLNHPTRAHLLFSVVVVFRFRSADPPIYFPTYSQNIHAHQTL